MSNEQPTFFQTTSRLAIMLGVLSCGSLAAWRYRPEPDRLADLIDQAASYVAAVPEASDTSSNQLTEAPPAFQQGAIGVASDIGSAPTFEDASPAEPPRWDTAVQPATALTPVERQPAASPPARFDALERDRLTAPALAAGATRADVQPWGDGGQPLYRATASAPVGPTATGLERQWDAYGATPEIAVASLVEELRNATPR